jgi:hypothetical protein
MFQAIAGLRNLRAAGAMLGCFVLALVAGGLISSIPGRGVGTALMASLTSILLVFSGIHASGVLLMDQARQVPMRSITQAVTYGLLCVPKTIGLLILLVLALIAVYVVLALLFWVSKMPGLGPVLFAILFPVSVLVAGLTGTGLVLALVIALAAFWDGAGVFGALGKAVVVLQKRLVETVMLVAVVSVLATFVGVFVGVVLGVGFLPAIGMSAGILGVEPSSLGGVGDLMSGFGGRGGRGGHVVAGIFGGLVLWVLAITLVMQVSLMGFNLIYLRVTEGLDSSATEGALHAGLAQARRKAAEVGAKAKEAKERARAQAEQAIVQRRAAAAAAKWSTPVVAASVAAPSAPVQEVTDLPAAAAPVAATVAPASVNSTSCPACQASVSVEDVFCGACGHRLQS